MHRFLNILFVALLLTATAARAEGHPAAIPVFVSIAPQKQFVQQIGGDRVEVRVMVAPGANPATYEPTPRQMAELARARIYFAIGVPFESAWLEKIAAANPQMTVVHTDAGIEKIPMATHDHPGAAHDPDEHGILDPHIWLSPPLVDIQARTVLTALQTADPPHRALYQSNYLEFATAVDRLDNRLKALFAEKAGLRFMVFHPAWGYFARAYGLEQVPIEIEGKAPKPAQLGERIEFARRAGVRVIFVQPQFSTRSAEIVAGEIGAEVVVADPLAEDWLTNLSRVADKFQAALR